MFKSVFVLIFVINITYVLSQNTLKCNAPNEHYECGSACQTTCKNYGERCPAVIPKCNDACYCDSGFARNDDDICVPIEDCSTGKK